MDPSPIKDVIENVEKARKVVPNDDMKYYDINLKAYRPGISQEEVVAAYEQWATKQTYDKDLGPERYRGPVIAASTVEECASNKNAHILDIAAGTGLVAQHLKSRGFHNIDALDPSSEMLKIAESKSLYKKYICDILAETPTSNIEDDAYDVVVTSGGMGEGHIKCNAMKELIRITKPEGFVIIVMRAEYIDYVLEYKDRLEPFMKRLGQAGYWKQMQKKFVDGYAFNKRGLVYVFNVKAEGFKNFDKYEA